MSPSCHCCRRETARFPGEHFVAFEFIRFLSGWDERHQQVKSRTTLGQFDGILLVLIFK